MAVKLAHCPWQIVAIVAPPPPPAGVICGQPTDWLNPANEKKHNKKIKVSLQNDLQKSLLATGFPYSSGENTKDLKDVIKKIENILPECQDLRRLGSASIDLCMVAKGVYEGYYEMNLKPWDVSAGVIILSEAGGRITNIRGTTFDMFKDKYIVASNGKIHDKLLSKLDI